MITGKVFSSPQNTYSKVLGEDLNSSFSGASNDGLTFLRDGAN